MTNPTVAVADPVTGHGIFTNRVLLQAANTPSIRAVPWSLLLRAAQTHMTLDTVLLITGFPWGEYVSSLDGRFGTFMHKPSWCTLAAILKSAKHNKDTCLNKLGCTIRLQGVT